MAKTATGRTADAGAPILGAGFWTTGKKVTGTYLRSFVTKLQDGEPGMCHQFLCTDPPTIEVPLNQAGRYDPKGELKSVDKFCVGALTGIEMALDLVKDDSEGWFKDFQYRDRVTFECTGMTPATQRGYSDMPEFQIQVSR